MSRVKELYEMVPGIPKVLINASCLMNAWVTKWLRGEDPHSRTHSLAHRLVLFCQWDSVRCVWARRGWGSALHRSTLGSEFRALASQLPWWWLLVASPFGLVLGLPGTWALGTHGPPSLSSSKTFWVGISLCNGMALFFLAPTDLSILCHLPKRWLYWRISLSITLFQSCFFYESQWCQWRGCLLLSPSPGSKLWEHTVRCTEGAQHNLLKEQIQVGCTNSRAWRNDRGQFWESVHRGGQPEAQALETGHLVQIPAPPLTICVSFGW